MDNGPYVHVGLCFSRKMLWNRNGWASAALSVPFTMVKAGQNDNVSSRTLKARFVHKIGRRPRKSWPRIGCSMVLAENNLQRALCRRGDGREQQQSSSVRALAYISYNVRLIKLGRIDIFIKINIK